MRENMVLKTLLLLLTLLLGLFLYNGIEVYEEEVPTPLSLEARQKPFLAAQRLMASRDVEMSIEEDYLRMFAAQEDSIIPGPGDGIILTSSQVVINQQTTESLMTWVNSGGHLILAVTNTDSEVDFRANQLIHRLGIEVTWEDAEGDALVHSSDEPSILHTDWDYDLEVNLEQRFRILLPEDSPVYYSAGDEHGITFVQLDFGEGLVTLMTDVEIWNNSQITDYDHAILLALLMDERDKVFVFTPRIQPHWLTLLWQFAPWFVVMGIIALIIAMWHFSGRLGPVFSGMSLQRSLFSDHIRAAGQYYWDHQRQVLLSGARDTLKEKAAVRWPGAHTQDPDTLVRLLSDLSGWPHSSVNDLLFSTQNLNEAQFTQWISGLQKLRNML